MLKGWLDGLSPAFRHFLFSVAGVVSVTTLVYLKENYTTWGIPDVFVGIIGAVLPLALAYVTNWSTQYGNGSGAPVTVNTGAAPQVDVVTPTPAVQAVVDPSTAPDAGPQK